MEKDKNPWRYWFDDVCDFKTEIDSKRLDFLQEMAPGQGWKVELTQTGIKIRSSKGGFRTIREAIDKEMRFRQSI